MERLQDIITTGRRKMAGHILRLQRERPANTAMYWVPGERWEAKEDIAEYIQRRQE